MNASELAEMLAGLPEQKLKIIGVFQDVVDDTGSLRPDRATERKGDIEGAISEARAVAAATQQVTTALLKIPPRPA